MIEVKKRTWIVVIVLALLFSSVEASAYALALDGFNSGSALVTAGENLKAQLSVLDNILATIYTKNIEGQDPKFSTIINPKLLEENSEELLYGMFRSSADTHQLGWDENGAFILPKGITIDEEACLVAITNEEDVIVLSVRTADGIDEVVGWLYSCFLQFEDTDTTTISIHKKDNNDFVDVSGEAGKYLSSYLLTYDVSLLDSSIRSRTWTKEYDGTMSIITDIFAIKWHLINVFTQAPTSIPEGVSVCEYDENVRLLSFTEDDVSLVFAVQTHDSTRLTGIAALLLSNAGMSLDDLSIIEIKRGDTENPDVFYADPMNGEDIMNALVTLFQMSLEEKLGLQN